MRSSHLIRVQQPQTDPRGQERQLAHRDWLSGLLIGVSLCWPFLLPSLIHAIHWYMFLPLALVAGYLRYERGKGLPASTYPLWGLVILLFVFFGVEAATHPIGDYGRSKLMQFVILAGIAYLSTIRQRPLTEAFARGFRFSLFAGLVLCLLLILTMRNLYLTPTDAEDLRASLSTVGMPLALALSACCLIPGRFTAWQLFLSSLALVATGVVEILVRGRFDAMVMFGLAVMLLFGPPWRHMFWRIALGVLLGVAGVMTFLVVLPELGKSYEYFQRLQRGDLGGRTPLIQIAWDGFMAHPMGQGIGSFEEREPVYKYPHNIVLETAYELGIFGLLCVLALYVLVLRRVWLLWGSPPHRLLIAPLVIVFLHILKAGDLAMFAYQWVLLYMLAVAVPLANDWLPVVRRKLQ